MKTPQRAHRRPAAASQVRIIGGEWRSRVLKFPELPGLRPTPDRVRETLFNWLGRDLTGMRCLDMFAGSGALAFEALSRNAREVVMVEHDARARAALEQSSTMLDCGARARIGGTDALQFSDSEAGGFDLIFLDPPFSRGLLELVWPRVDALAAPAGLVYIESGSPFAPDAPWATWKSGRAGAVFYQLAKRSEQVAAARESDPRKRRRHTAAKR